VRQGWIFRPFSVTLDQESAMKSSASVGLTIVAAVALGAPAAQRLDPCASATFNESACQAAIQNRGYCSNNRWVRMTYRQPYPYYYDAYQNFVGTGGTVSAAQAGSCGAPGGFWIFSHGGSHRGFGATGAGHTAHG
jgi:hypothetical protein